MVNHTNMGVMAAVAPCGKNVTSKSKAQPAHHPRSVARDQGKLSPWRANHHAAATMAQARTAASNQHHVASELAYAGSSAAAKSGAPRLPSKNNNTPDNTHPPPRARSNARNNG